MSSSFDDALAEFRATVDQYARRGLHGMAADEMRILIKRITAFERRLAAQQHELINQLIMAPPEELGGELPDVLDRRLRISRSDAVRRIQEAHRWAAESGK
jgi:hypothetical protein